MQDQDIPEATRQVRKLLKGLDDSFSGLRADLVDGLMKHRRDTMRADALDRFGSLAGSLTMLCLGALLLPRLSGEGVVLHGAAMGPFVVIALTAAIAQLVLVNRGDQVRGQLCWSLEAPSFSIELPDGSEEPLLDGGTIKGVVRLMGHVAEDHHDLGLPFPASRSPRGGAGAFIAVVTFLAIEGSFAAFGAFVGGSVPGRPAITLTVLALVALAPHAWAAGTSVVSRRKFINKFRKILDHARALGGETDVSQDPENYSGPVQGLLSFQCEEGLPCDQRTNHRCRYDHLLDGVIADAMKHNFARSALGAKPQSPTSARSSDLQIMLTTATCVCIAFAAALSPLPVAVRVFAIVMAPIVAGLVHPLVGLLLRMSGVGGPTNSKDLYPMTRPGPDGES